MRLDAHLHLWRRVRGDYGWLTPARGPLWRDFEAQDAALELRAASMDKAILVQAAPTLAETVFLREIAQTEPWVFGVVGWTDFAASNAAEQIADLASTSGLLGLRPMIQDIPDPDWILRADVANSLTAMADTHLVFDALIHPMHLPHLIKIAQRLPGLQIVLDHAAKPALDAGVPPQWQADIVELAKSANVSCKLSGLITEARGAWNEAMLAPFLDVLFESFGPDRLLWGSDWPVCTLRGTYSAWLDASERLVRTRTDDFGFACVFGGAAARVYGGPP
jgi:L-fuconolactonase